MLEERHLAKGNLRMPADPKVAIAAARFMETVVDGTAIRQAAIRRNVGGSRVIYRSASGDVWEGYIVGPGRNGTCDIEVIIPGCDVPQRRFGVRFWQAGEELR